MLLLVHPAHGPVIGVGSVQFLSAAGPSSGRTDRKYRPCPPAFHNRLSLGGGAKMPFEISILHVVTLLSTHSLSNSTFPEAAIWVSLSRFVLLLSDRFDTCLHIKQQLFNKFYALCHSEYGINSIFQCLK